MVGRPSHHILQIGVVVAEAGQDRHHARTGEDAGPDALLHGLESLPGWRGQAFHLADPLAMLRVGRGDDAREHDGGGLFVDGLQQVQVSEHQRRALQHRDGKAQLQADLQHPPGDLELALSRLVVAGGYDVDRNAAERPAQQGGCILLDLDAIGKVGRVIVGVVLFLASIAVLMDTTCKALSL